MNNNEVKDDYSYWSENLHSSYLFYTMEVDKLNKLNKQLTQKLEKSREYIKYLEEYRRMSVTCQECYDEGVYIGRQQALKELEEL